MANETRIEHASEILWLADSTVFEVNRVPRIPTTNATRTIRRPTNGPI